MVLDLSVAQWVGVEVHRADVYHYSGKLVSLGRMNGAKVLVCSGWKFIEESRVQPAEALEYFGNWVLVSGDPKQNAVQNFQLLRPLYLQLHAWVDANFFTG